jgi:hypothetical protein
MAQIFISYRRQDSAYLAATLSDKLQQHFGPNSVFLDVDNIPLGVDFREYIGNAVGQCDVLLVIIGDEWMGPTDSQGKRRIDDPSDYMRVEIESALKRNIPVIPVLIEEATMPAPADLPPAIESIAFRNAAEIRAGRDLRQHIDQLIRGLETIIKTSPPAAKEETKSDDEIANDNVSASAMANKLLQARKERISRLAGDYSALVKEIQLALKDFSDSHVYVGQAVPADKLANAIGSYARDVTRKDVLLFFDNTVFGGAKEGLLLTTAAVYWHNIAGLPGRISYSEILKVNIRETTSLFAAAKILINEDEIEVNVADNQEGRSYLYVINQLAKVLSDAIRHLTEHLSGHQLPG